MLLGGGLYFFGFKASVYEMVSKFYMIKKIGNDHFFDSNTEAIKSIYKRLDKDRCAGYQALVFNERTPPSLR